MIDFTQTHGDAFSKAKTLYGTTADEWNSIMTQYTSIIDTREVLPDGFERIKGFSGLAINQSGTIINTVDLTMVCPTRDPHRGLVVEVKGVEYVVSYLVLATFVDDFYNGAISYKDGDIFNPSVKNLILADVEHSGLSTLEIADVLGDGIEQAIALGKVDSVSIGKKAITEIRSGDLVVSYGEVGIVAKPVIASMEVIVREDEQVTIETASGKFHTSKKHPVPVSYDGDGKSEWKAAGDVEVDDLLLISNNGVTEDMSIVTAITDEKKDIRFRDLTVKDTNCYFIAGDGDSAHLIHNTRKGAIAVYIEPWHIDIQNFLDAKKTSTEARLATHDLFPALWVNDLFFERANNDEDWTLFDSYHCPDLHTLYGEEFNKRYMEYENDPTIPKETIKAKTLVKHILTLYFETGSPFLLMKDEVNRRHQCENIGVVRSSNLCVEIMNATAPGTLLSTVTLVNGEIMELPADEYVVTDSGVSTRASRLNHFDSINGVGVAYVENRVVDKKTSVCNLMSVNLGKLEEISDLEEMMKVMVRATDNVIDVNFYPVGHARNTNIENRSIGIGAMGEHHFLAKRGIHYGSQEHFEIIDELYEAMSYYAIKASAEIAQEKGSYPLFEGSNWSKGILPIDTANEDAKALTSRKYTMDWDALRELVKKGMRNGYVLAIAPTSTISVHTSTTSSVEPVYKRSYVEESMNLMTKVIAPDLSAGTWNYYTGAYDIDQSRLVLAAAVRQKWIDQSQSLTLFIKEGSMSGGQLYRLYDMGRKLGIKSFYYLRTESPETLEHVEKINTLVECESCQ